MANDEAVSLIAAGYDAVYEGLPGSPTFQRVPTSTVATVVGIDRGGH